MEKPPRRVAFLFVSWRRETGPLRGVRRGFDDGARIRAREARGTWANPRLSARNTNGKATPTGGFSITGLDDERRRSARQCSAVLFSLDLTPKAILMKKRRIIALSTLAVAAIYFFTVGKLEASRIATPLDGGTSVSGPAPDSTMLMNDVRTLASPAFKGRRTGSDGSKMAQAYITKRYVELGLQPYGTSYAMPFSFTQHSIRGLFSAGKKYSNEFPAAVNLIGYIKGSAQPERVMVVSAHYDHLGERNGLVYPGADDNASGVAAMLATAAYFQQHPPLHTVVFAAFDAEELGLRGSEAFVKALPFPRAQLALDLNFDMVSRSDSNELWVAGLRYSPELKTLVAAAAKHSTVKLKVGHDKPMLLAGAVEDWTASSDHGNFHDAGVPFLYFGVDDHADYHQPTDSTEKINPAFYANVASLLIDVAMMADRNLQMLE
jgi:hypothetical protein